MNQRRLKLTDHALKSDAELYELADRISDAIKEKQAPEGTLGLSTLLDKRRLEYGIPNEAFEATCLFDRVILWQIQPKYQENTKQYAGTTLWMPETAQKRELQESCRGVVVSAGFAAMDTLESNGIELGSICSFVKYGPWHKPIGTYATVMQHVILVRDGDLFDCEDLKKNIEAGVVGVVRYEKEAGVYERRVTQPGLPEMKPKMPFVDESY